jgi:hypothetical protein
VSTFIPNRTGARYGAFSLIRRIVPRRLQSAVTRRSSDEGNRRGWPIAGIWRPTAIVPINNLW